MSSKCYKTIKNQNYVLVMKMFFCFQILQVIHLSKIELKHCAGQKSIKKQMLSTKN